MEGALIIMGLRNGNPFKLVLRAYDGESECSIMDDIRALALAIADTADHEEVYLYAIEVSEHSVIGAFHRSGMFTALDGNK